MEALPPAVLDFNECSVIAAVLSELGESSSLRLKISIWQTESLLDHRVLFYVCAFRGFLNRGLTLTAIQM